MIAANQENCGLLAGASDCIQPLFALDADERRGPRKDLKMSNWFTTQFAPGGLVEATHKLDRVLQT